MVYKGKERQESTTIHSDALSFVKHFIKLDTVVDSTGHHHSFLKFEWLGRWGICSSDKQQIFVRAKANYLYAKALIKAKVLIAGDHYAGWDVYSLEGKFLETLDPMTLDEVTIFLDSKWHTD